MASVNRQPGRVRAPVQRATHLGPKPGNPRRQPSHLSVSLVHNSEDDKSHRSAKNSNTSNEDASLVSNKATLSDTPSRFAFLQGMTSSGESSNAEGWFDRSNNQVHRDAAASPYADSDPPFFMRNSSSSQSPPDAEQQQHFAQMWQNNGSHMLPHRPGLMELGTDGNSNEEYRSVIDDLTVENQKLKRRLKKYGKLHDSHLKDEKLFEIRVHGLPVDKKRELEEMLRNFASNMHTPTGTAFPISGYDGLAPALNTHKTSSSLTSQFPSDSAYASMSASGQGSLAPSASDSKHSRFAPTAKSRHQNIQSYLHRIPEGLMPQQNPTVMSEHTKQKVVVSRLEQIFAGKGAAAGPHHQALQQQDVSQSAAHADRSAMKEQGRAARNEGVREAPIMEKETEDPMDSTTNNPTKLEESVQAEQLRKEQISEQDFSSGSPDHSQRPTRPLDLDPDRAQVPAENLRYIRHLGFSPLDLDSSRSPQEGHGWIYLNVLINMAQLHTLNVTADFVRKSLADLSDRLEVSNDGRKVRWKGRGKKSAPSSLGSVAYPHNSSAEDETGAPPRKRVKLAAPDDGRASSYQRGTASQWGSRADSSKLLYTPLFYHRDDSDESEASSTEGEDENMSMGFQQLIAGDSSGMTGSNVRTSTTNSKKKEKREDGPIIFYNNARFLTDLSGDSGPPDMTSVPMYKLADVQPIGKPHAAPGTKMLESRGPLSEVNVSSDSMNLDEKSPSSEVELDFTSLPTPTMAAPSAAISPTLEASGIGGVYPADHFAVTVQTRQTHSTPRQSCRPVPSRLGKILQARKRDRAAQRSIATQILGVKRVDRMPSALPPALCYLQSNSSDEDDIASNYSSSSVAQPGAPHVSTAPQPLGLTDHPSDFEASESLSEDSDNESDGSLDLLAAARAMDPEGVMAREREFDSHMAERLAEEIPAGSSAATAGGRGGSGFNSPGSEGGGVGYRKAARGMSSGF
ncbi:hypothetical protein B0A48_10705 [Cryoendolithus antarcticus]|uniref:Frequency clock protein n=1 Tax=Cryoendolithus antarcticus TaxID=1507870 RepID=A0A1V8SYS5_9PEZI|nr:hypothetical protein B0A48_10705 [Cryoendolithus antarcticus]